VSDYWSIVGGVLVILAAFVAGIGLFVGVILLAEKLDSIMPVVILAVVVVAGLVFGLPALYVSGI
jgi:hypothetical protein